MKIRLTKPIRYFQVGLKKNKFFIKDLAHVSMNLRDVLLINKKDLKITKYNWGFEINNKLNNNIDKKFVFAGSNYSKIHLMYFFLNKKNNFLNYCKKEKLKIIQLNELFSLNEK